MIGATSLAVMSLMPPGAFGTMMVMGLPFWGKSGAAEKPADGAIALIAKTHTIPKTQAL